jgi:hypothetical protein
MSYSFNLYRLQQIDTKLDQARNRLTEIDKILNEDSELILVQDAFENSKLNLGEGHKLLQKAEEAVNNLKVKIEQTESTLYSGKVHNPKELQDLQAESAALKRHLVTLEDRELEAMELIEELEEKLSSTTHILHDVQSRRASQMSIVNGEKHLLLNQITQLETDRQILINMINPPDLEIYDQLRKQRRGVAVSTAFDKSCSSCGSQLTPAIIQTAFNSPVLVRCPTCNRIIYPG